MRPTTATLSLIAASHRHDDAGIPNHKRLGNGLYAVAYLQPDGTVLKVSRECDGSMDYIEWCWLRMKKFGRGSIEMANLPEVEHFGRTEKGWWAVMPCYVEAEDHCTEAGISLRVGYSYDYVFREAIKPVVKMVEKVFEPEWLDIHSGNVMWDRKREQWVVTDPLADDATGTRGKGKQPSRFKQPAAWKRTPLQCLRRRA